MRRSLAGKDRRCRDDTRQITDAGGVSSIRLNYKQDYFGFQLGSEVASRATAAGEASLGVTGGYLKSKLDFARSEQRGKIESFNFGAYVNMTHDNLFANVLAQYAHHDIEARDPDLGYDAHFNGKSVGLDAEFGARLGTAKLLVEPLASLTYVRSDLGNMVALGQEFDFDKLDSLSGRLGGKLAGQTKLKSGETLVLAASAAAVHVFDGEAGLDFVSGRQTQHVTDDRVKTYGQVSVGLTLVAKHGLTAFVQGQGEFGADYKGGTGRIGVRLNF